MRIAVIDERHVLHIVFGRLLHQFLHPNGAIEERVLGVQMKMNERIAGHPFSV
jgi:hypothetical protein